jgi:hypothetical protein
LNDKEGKQIMDNKNNEYDWGRVPAELWASHAEAATRQTQEKHQQDLPARRHLAQCKRLAWVAILDAARVPQQTVAEAERALAKVCEACLSPGTHCYSIAGRDAVEIRAATNAVREARAREGASK